jgi:hypothetical protein
MTLPSSSILITLLCLTASGCVTFSADEPSPSQTVVAPPEGKRLVELVNDAFKTAKLSGTPEVSPVHPAHDAEWGDWMFCIKSNNSDQSPKYAVLIGANSILEVRSFVLIDGCDKETYHPVEIAGRPGDSHRNRAGSLPRSRQHDQTKAP